MTAINRTWLGIVCLVLVAGAVGASLQMPWFVFTSSSGSNSPPGGPTGADDESVVREHLEIRANQVTGDHTVEDTGRAEAVAKLIGMALVGLLGVAGIALLLEFAAARWEWGRWVSMAVVATGFLGLVALLVYGWFELPRSLAAEGVTEPFTAVYRGDVYVRTELGLAYFVAGASGVLQLAFLGFKFATGKIDLDEFHGRYGSHAATPSAVAPGPKKQG